MKKIFLFLACISLTVTFSTRTLAQDSSKEKIIMKRYVVERTFPKGLNLPVNEKGIQIVNGVISNNNENHVTWVQSYVSADKKKTYCIYDAPSPVAIRKAAKENGIPVDKITEVKVLDPYFFN